MIGDILESNLTDRQRQVLAIIRAADQPIAHYQIVKAIECPWYDVPASMSASVSSTLGVLRSKGFIKAQARPVGGKLYNGVQPTRRYWSPKAPRHASGGVIAKPWPTPIMPPTGLHAFQAELLDQIRNSMGIPAVLLAAADDRAGYSAAAASLISRERSFKLSVFTGTSLNPKNLDFKRPITDDMAAMVDDLNRVEETPASRYARSSDGAMKRISKRLDAMVGKSILGAFRNL